MEDLLGHYKCFPGLFPMQMYELYFMVMKNRTIWRCVNSNMCPTLQDAFIVKSVSKCPLFTYILEHFQ